MSLVFEGSPAADAGARSRPTIGLLVDTLFDAYEEAIWNGVMAAAEELDLHVLAFVGGAYVERRAGQNGVFELIHPDNVDGLVSLSGSMGNWISADELAARYRTFAGLPLVSVSKLVPGVPNVLIDNETGLAALLDHLVLAHGRRRIAFVRGPPTNDDAEIRWRVYRERLAAHGLPFDPALVYDGDFDRVTGRLAVRTLLDERHARFDALVGANDYMALYAMQELLHRGVRVPEDVAVAGFDDIADAAGATPPLSTVRQPFERIGRDAVRTLAAVLRGEQVPPRQTIPAVPVFRRSCGCAPELAPRRAPAPAGDPAARAPLARHLAELFPELGAELLDDRWAGALAAAVEESAAAGTPARLEAELDRLVALGLARAVAASRWYPVVEAAFAHLRAGPAAAPALAPLERAALVHVGVAGERVLAAHKARADEEFKLLRRVFMPSDLNERR
ncbi:MAG TPA: substrate-binding domain-containing protein [Anaeromyxobacter sp.]|nr:substrate-binding domain-containing protein [Anaeromyxobacter sp.]